MRICILTPTSLPRLGGAEICIDKLAQNFIRLGHQTVVVAQQARQRDSSFPREYSVVRYRRPISQYGSYTQLKRLLVKLHRKHDFHILNAHIAYPGAYVGQWFAERFDIPLVVTTHGAAIFHRSRFRGRPIVWNRIREGLSHAYAVVSLSSYSDNVIAQIAPTQKYIIRIGNGVDKLELAGSAVELSAFYRQQCGRKFILGLGRLVAVKGFDVALEAFARIYNRYPDLRLVIVGEGPERLKLEQQAIQLHIQSQVVFLGTVIGPQKTALLQNCLFTIQPSVAEDNMPLTILESMACSKPVLASRLGGIPDLVRDNENGRLCPPGDIEQFAQGMSEMLESDSLDKMSQAACQTVRDLDWQDIAKRYLELFNKILAEKARAKPLSVETESFDPKG